MRGRDCRVSRLRRPRVRAASPCRGLVYTCQNSRVEVYRVTSADQRPPGLDAEAAVGDLVLENDYVRVVIDAIDHPHHLATSGGNILDIAPRGAGDHLNLIYTITGILPRDGVKYTSLELLTKTDLVAVIARGALDGDSRATVTTRYELRPCDRGLRVRTEVFNGGRTLATWFLGDAWWWGDRSLTPFIPTQGNGFVHPPLDLLEIDNSWRLTPWMAAQSHAAPAVSYATLSCTRASLEGVQDSTISAVGLPRTIVRPGDGQVFERMIFAAAGGGIAGAGALALEAHAKLFGGAVTTLTGRVTTTAGVAIGGDERLASVIAYEPSPTAPDDPNAGTVWSQAVPSENGRFTLAVPSNKSLRVQLHRFGRATTTSMTTRSTGASVELGDLRVAPAGVVEVQVREDLTDAPIASEVVLVPVEGETSASSVSGSVHGALSEPSCAPFLGPPHGSSPACNRVLAFDGGALFAAPAGTYWVYGTAGPSTTLARQRITVREGEIAQAELRLRRIGGLYPADSVSADMHVHGGRSFDTAFPDTDRVQSFVTAGVDVIIATDHDVVTSYQSAVADLGVADRVVIVPGVEATPLVPWLVPPGDTFPRVIGHWMFWPMRYDATLPSNGMPWDERAEPGQLFARMRARMTAEGVMQLNHPTAHSKAGRDEGYFRMLGFNPARPLPLADDGTPMGMLWRRPGGPTSPPQHRLERAGGHERLRGRAQPHVPRELVRDAQPRAHPWRHGQQRQPLAHDRAARISAQHRAGGLRPRALQRRRLQPRRATGPHRRNQRPLHRSAHDRHAGQRGDAERRRVQARGGRDARRRGARRAVDPRHGGALRGQRTRREDRLGRGDHDARKPIRQRGNRAMARTRRAL